MSGRGFSTEELAAASARHSTVVPMVELLFDSGTLRLALGGLPVEHEGITWAATGALATLQTSQESADGTEGMAFEMSGLSPDIVTLAAAEPYRGRIFRLLEQWLDDDLQPVAPPRVEWIGRLTALAVEESDGKAVVSGSAEHYEADLRRPRSLRYTGAEQQRRFPGDTGLDGVEQMTEIKLVWPTKEAQRK